MDDLYSRIRAIRDFPKPGVVFRDITTLLKDGGALRAAVSGLLKPLRDQQIHKVVAIEARGFILGGIIASELGAGFVPIRKPGKLPGQTLRQEYQLEYGTDAVEIHRDAISPSDRVLIHDDLLATGGTALAAVRLVETLGGTVECLSFLVELPFLGGRNALGAYHVLSLLRYESE